MVRPMSLLLAAGLLAMSAAAIAEDVYKWVDAQGQVHFGSRPPADVKAQKVTPHTTEPASAAPTSTWQQQLGQSNLRRLQKQQQEAQDARKQQQLSQRCLAAQRALDALNRGGAIYRVNSQGEREYMSDEQRQAAIAAANQRVATYCR